MRRLLVAAVAVLLVTPSAARAEIMRFHVTGFAGELSVIFGQVPFQLDDHLLREAGFAGFPFPGFQFDGGLAFLESGPLLDLEQFSSPSGDRNLTRYTYGPGTLALSLTVSASHGGVAPVSGAFLAPTDGFSLVVCEECDTLFGGGNAADFHIRFGPGLFDAAFAEFMNIKRETGFGFIDFGLEAIGGSPLDERRIGFDHRGFANLEIGVVVPEPAPLVLALTAAAIFWRRGTSRARTSAPR